MGPWWFTVQALAACLGSCAVLERVQQIPPGWTATDKEIDLNTPISLSIALRQPSIDHVRTALHSGTRLSQDRAQALRQPSQKDVDYVSRWLEQNDIKDYKQDHSFIRVRTTACKAQALLHMKLGQYQFKHAQPVLRTEEYSVPNNLADSISFVHPVANFMAPNAELQRVPSPAPGLHDRSNQPPCAAGTTPDCIRAMYQMPAADSVPGGSSDVRLGVAGFLDRYANYQDIQGFLDQAAPSIGKTGYNFTTELVNNGQNSQDPSRSGLEPALDMDFAMSLGYPSGVTFYSTGGRGTKLDDAGKPFPDGQNNNEPYLDLIEYLLSKPDDQIPHVLSISYADDELSVPRPYAEQVCKMLGLLTARGTSILSGSGDGGSQGIRNSTCLANDGSGRQVAMAAFPGTCPWVTAVGGTTASVDPAEAATFSGGGFSQYFPREDWQAGAVDGYVKQLGGHLDGKYNASMRATPDISAIGTNFRVLIAHTQVYVQGTSASSPVVAAMVALANAERLKQGKPVLGWLNRYLYQDAVTSVVNDVKVGQTQSCTWDGQAPGGWTATPGWDAATGVGTVGKFEDLKNALVSF